MFYLFPNYGPLPGRILFWTKALLSHPPCIWELQSHSVPSVTHLSFHTHSVPQLLVSLLVTPQLLLRHLISYHAAFSSDLHLKIQVYLCVNWGKQKTKNLYWKPGKLFVLSRNPEDFLFCSDTLQIYSNNHFDYEWSDMTLYHRKFPFQSQWSVGDVCAIVVTSRLIRRLRWRRYVVFDASVECLME